MTTRILKNPKLVVGFSLLILLSTLIAAPQDARALAQFGDAGESASHDPEDTGDRGAADAREDAELAARETLTAAEQAAALKRRAGEQVAGDPLGAALVLGMHLQEDDRGRAKVVEVAPASPAFDAGVREGDMIVSIDGFRGKSYRDWLDGIRKLVTDTPDGATMALEVMRGGKQVGISIRVPEANADDIRRAGPLRQPLLSRSEGELGTLPAGPQPIQPFGAGADNDIFINNAPFNQAFNVEGDMTGRAVAHIFRLSTPQQTAAANDTNDPSNPASAPRAASDATATDAVPNAAERGGRIGLAGFRNDQTGMLVMIDVGGLAPGSYRVSIEDPGLVMGGGDSTLNAPAHEAGVPANPLPPPNPGADINSLQNVPGQGVSPTQRGNQLNRARDSRQSHIDQLPAEEPPTVLAQVADTGAAESATPPTGQVSPTATPPTGTVLPPATPPTGRELPPGAPPTGRVLPPGAPPTGRVLPPGAPPTGLADDVVNNNQSGRSGGLSAGESGFTLNTGSLGTLPAIGNLIVDQSGTGRLQQIVEGLQVRDVVGQALVIFAPINPPETALPPNNNVSGIRAGAVRDSRVGTQPPPVAGSRQLPGQPQAPVQGVGQTLQDSPMPVAAGVIRLLSDRRPGDVASATEEQIPQTQEQPTNVNPSDANALRPQIPIR